MRIEHLAFKVADASQQAQWYVAHLGMRILRQANDLNQTHFIVDDSEQVILELYCNRTAPLPDYAAMQSVTLHIAFSAEDIRAERDQLLGVGATADGEITETPAGDQLIFLRDPWGVCIQLAQRQHPLLPVKARSS